MTVCFVDANIPMYLVGADHPNKDLAAAALERAIGDGDRLVTDVEVLQEILHRYTAIERPQAIQPAFDLLLGVVDETYGIEVDDVQEAKRVVLGGFRVSARDALHIAVMGRRDVTTIMTFDRGFEGYPGIRRIG